MSTGKDGICNGLCAISFTWTLTSFIERRCQITCHHGWLLTCVWRAGWVGLVWSIDLEYKTPASRLLQGYFPTGLRHYNHTALAGRIYFPRRRRDGPVDGCLSALKLIRSIHSEYIWFSWRSALIPYPNPCLGAGGGLGGWGGGHGLARAVSVRLLGSSIW